MMTSRDIELLPEDDQAVTRASYDYYRALLSGAPEDERRRLRRIWLTEIQRRWPGLELG
jgi:hypothetical protein